MAYEPGRDTSQMKFLQECINDSSGKSQKTPDKHLRDRRPCLSEDHLQQGFILPTQSRSSAETERLIQLIGYNHEEHFLSDPADTCHHLCKTRHFILQSTIMKTISSLLFLMLAITCTVNSQYQKFMNQHYAHGMTINTLDPPGTGHIIQQHTMMKTTFFLALLTLSISWSAIAQTYYRFLHEHYEQGMRVTDCNWKMKKVNQLFFHNQCKAVNSIIAGPRINDVINVCGRAGRPYPMPHVHNLHESLQRFPVVTCYYTGRTGQPPCSYRATYSFEGPDIEPSSLNKDPLQMNISNRV
ncbi:hypothetical protein GJAV_G00256290 [Gymnothorax javanicus]|nr:hypothetical protein GJAV_G00256290 [Gymnothorax javanicus]